MFGKKTPKPQSRIDSLIGNGTRIVGDVFFSGGLRVDGEVTGNIQAQGGQPSTLVLSEQAKVTGTIEVSHLVANGSICGPVYVTEYAELQPKAKVVGDVHYKKLEMHMGAIVDGRLVHEEKAPLALPPVKDVLEKTVVD
ncbi:MAG: polymer-forming cytoskeletal protein [Sulfuricellaceae bacterium]|nr:polymer-forming cytoskeletal protein [Sulfuricellaceae bacterium]